MPGSSGSRMTPPGSRDAREAAYFLTGVALGGPALAVVGSLQISGVAAAFAPLGILLAMMAQVLLRPLARLERKLAAGILGDQIAAPLPLETLPSWDRARAWAAPGHYAVAALRDGHSWRVLVWLLARAPLGIVGLVLLPSLLIGAPEVHRRLADVQRRFARWALGPGRREAHAEAIARAVRAEERIRVDQELHDSLGHLLSLIAVQAGAGAHVFERDPAFARRALTTVEERARAALGELDRIIADLRDAPRAALSGAFAPTDLASLVADARSAGVRIRTRIDSAELPDDVGRVVFRVAQEALTNAVRHAPGAVVDLELTADPERAALRVANDLIAPAHRIATAVPTATGQRVPGSAEDGAASPALHPPEPSPETRQGNGLASMRDRCRTVGGTFLAQPTDGRFVVSAVFPLPEPGEV